MSNVLEYVRSKEPRFKDVPDDTLTHYIGDRHPEFLEKDHAFLEDYGRIVSQAPGGSLSGVQVRKPLEIAPGEGQAGDITRAMEAPEQMRAYEMPSPEAIARGVGQPLRSDEEWRLEYAKEAYGQKEMPTEDFLKDHRELAPLTTPTITTPKLTDKEGELLAGKTLGPVVAGTQRFLTGIVDFFSSPAGIATIGSGAVAGGATALLKEGISRATLYTWAEEMFRHSPEQVKGVVQAWENGDIGSATEQTLGLLPLIGVGLGAAKSLAPKSLSALKGTYASEVSKTTEVHEPVLTFTGEGLQEMPTTVSSERVQPRTLPQETLSLEDASYLKAEREALDLGVASNKELGLPAEVKVVEELPPDQVPWAKGMIAWVEEDGGITVNRPVFRDWLKSLPENKRTKAVNSMMAEEGIHSIAQNVITDAEMESLWKSLSEPERKLVEKTYFGSKEEQAKYRPMISDANMGHEFIRRAMQRLLRMNTSEVAEAKGTVWLKQQVIDTIERVIALVRKTLGTKTNATIEELLGRIKDNAEGARMAEKGETLFAFRRGKEEKTAELFLPPVEGAVERPTAAEVGALKEPERVIIGPDDIGFEKPFKQAPWRRIEEDESNSPRTMDRIATIDARIEGSDRPISHTNRLLVMVDKTDKTVHMVSVYPRSVRGEAGRVEAMAVDPLRAKASKPNVPLSTLLERYRPIYSVLNRDVVQNYHHKFNNLQDFYGRYGDEAIARSRREISEPPTNVSQSDISGRPAEWQHHEPVSETEAFAVLKAVRQEVGVFDSPEDVKLTLPTLSGDALSGAIKLAAEISRKNPEFGAEQVIEELGKQIYENAKQSKTVKDFQRRTMALGPAERHQEAATGASADQEARGPAAFFRGKKTLDDVISEPVSWYSEWMVDRIRRAGGVEAGRAADTFNKVIDREKSLYGSLTPSLDPARREAGKPGKATTWLHGLKKITPFAAVSNTPLAIENKISVPAYAQHVVNLAQQANLLIGRMYQSVSPGFVAGGKFQRNLNSFGYDIIRQGHGDAWLKWTAATARANKANIVDVRSFFTDWKALLDKKGADFNALEKVNQDFKRRFPNVVSHLKLHGQWQPVIHADLFAYLETAARRASHIKAFREQFPNDAAGRAAFAAMEEGVKKELPQYQGDYDALMRSLQGHPTDTYSDISFLSAGRTIPEAFRFVNNTVGNLFAKMVLSGQMFVQPGETIAGSTPMFLGYRNYAEGLASIKQIYAQMEQAGQVNRVMFDWSFDPHSSVRSAFRMGGNVFARGFGEQFFNEMQEAAAAATARVVTERIGRGTLSDWEKRNLPQTFKAMGFTEPQVQAMMTGDMGLLGQFERKAAAWLTGGNKAIAEGSKIGANRFLNSVFRFQTYPMMKMNQLRAVTKNLWEAKTPTERWHAAEQFARFAFGNTLQGALTVALTTLAYQGLSGLGIKKQEAKDEPFKFMVESLLSSLSGPLYLIWRGARSGGIKGLGDQAMRLIFPYTMMTDLMDMVQGAGRYHDRDNFAKVGEFVKQKIPGTRAISTGLAAVGLSHENKELDSAISGFYRWRRDELGHSDRQDFLNEDDRKEFRMHMRKFVDAIKEHDKPAMREERRLAIRTAKGEDKEKAFGASLAARKILKTPDGRQLSKEQKSKLRERIGNEAFQRLEHFDAMLDALAP